MSAVVQRYSSQRFTEWAPLIALGALALLAIAAALSALFSRQLLNERVVVSPGETIRLPPVQPRQSPIGALRIDATAQSPDNAWVTFEVQVLDNQGNLLASAIKQAWRESGAWQEEGESGTWSEQDLIGSLDIRRATINEPVVVAISVLQQGSVSGQSLLDPVPFRVSIWDGVTDHRFLLSGILGVLILAALSAVAVKNSGQEVISHRVNDSDIGERATVGGADALVRVIVNVISDETTPQIMHADLYVKDISGKGIYRRQLPLSLSFRQDDGKIDSAKGYCALDLVLEPKGSYGFYVEIVPDAPVDWTQLKVKQGVRTLLPTEVIHLKQSL